jgi:hypothetical protein
MHNELPNMHLQDIGRIDASHLKFGKKQLRRLYLCIFATQLYKRATPGNYLARHFIEIVCVTRPMLMHKFIRPALLPASMHPRISVLINRCVHKLVTFLINASTN